MMRGQPLLVCSIPVSVSEEDHQYHIPLMPDIWQDISAKKIISLFNTHNLRLIERNML